MKLIRDERLKYFKYWTFKCQNEQWKLGKLLGY